MADLDWKKSRPMSSQSTDQVEITYGHLQLADIEEACVVIARAFCDNEPLTDGADSYPGMLAFLQKELKYLLTCGIVLAKAVNRNTGVCEVAGVFTAADFTDAGYVQIEGKDGNLPAQVLAFLNEIRRLFVQHLTSIGNDPGQDPNLPLRYFSHF